MHFYHYILCEMLGMGITMKGKSKIILIVGAVLICLAVVAVGGIKTIYNHKNINEETAHVKVSYVPENLDSLTEDSDIIVEGTSTQLQEEFKYDDISFYKTQVKIRAILKGRPISKNECITILQTNSTEDPVIEKNGNVILFLEKYEGPIIIDAYVCKGLSQGHYKVVDSKVLSSNANLLNDNLKNELKSNDTVEKFVVRIKAKVKD